MQNKPNSPFDNEHEINVSEDGDDVRGGETDRSHPNTAVQV